MVCPNRCSHCPSCTSAFSSAWSLAESVARRLEALSDENAEPELRQIGLPLDDPTGDLVRADEPPVWPEDLHFEDVHRERRLLAGLLAAARAAGRAESKIHRLNALLRRTREPAVVFTEYRDTLAHVRSQLVRPSVVLHGGLTRNERAAALAAFAASADPVLLATDAAAEGLNLHEHCRLIVNLELPWNPMRLEQRIGRVDRIGQRRVVHAFHLIAADIGEVRLAERLRRRVAVATDALGAPNPLDDERALARFVLRREDDDGIRDAAPERCRD
jgi:superfamily II DNA/RNA helicase